MGNLQVEAGDAQVVVRYAGRVRGYAYLSPAKADRLAEQLKRAARRVRATKTKAAKK